MRGIREKWRSLQSNEKMGRTNIRVSLRLTMSNGKHLLLR